MPSLQVRQRRAANAARGANDIEGMDFDSPQHQHQQQQQQQQQQPDDQKNTVQINPVLRFLINYPSFILVFLILLFVIVSKILGFSSSLSFKR